MTNREIVDYILSNKMDETKVIKEIEKDDFFKDDEAIMYIFYDGIDFYDENGKINIKRFCDETPNLAGHIRFNYVYEVISKEQAIKEIEAEEKAKKIKQLEDELMKLKTE